MTFTGITYVYEAVEDLARSREFYEDKLGFRLNTSEEAVNGYFIGPHYLVVEQVPNLDGDDRGRGTVTCVGVDDVDAYHAVLRERGVDAGAIADHPWGQRDFYVSDPDGYRWCFAQQGT